MTVTLVPAAVSGPAPGTAPAPPATPALHSTMHPALHPGLAAAKAAYTTRFVDRAGLAGLVTDRSPRVGDLVLARVTAIGQHQRIERIDGRRARLYHGDLVLVAYGDRYAPDQFEAIIPDDLGPCDLVAAGGVAARVRVSHDNMKPATRLQPLGLVAGLDGTVANLCDHRLPDPSGLAPRPHTLVVVGTSMNSGKTTTAAGLIRGLSRRGLRVGSAKVTGTGAGGDLWTMVDAGASPVLDFTAAGHPSTYRLGGRTVAGIHDFLLGHLADAAVDVAVIEIADGLFQEETADLLTSPQVLDGCDGVVFAAQDAIGARAGVDHLLGLGVPVLAASGLFTAAPLGVREARATVDLPILTLEDLHAGSHDLGPIAPPTVPAPHRPDRR